MSSPILSGPTPDLAAAMQGIWWLLSREDWTKDGERKIDPVLGADPLAILCYSPNHFAGQFMKRDRSDNADVKPSYAGKNNTVAEGGYDAYFGTYQVEEGTGRVAHTLLGSVIPSNIGLTVFRDLRVHNNKLIIQLETTTQEGIPIIRTLTWQRLDRERSVSQ